MNRKELVTALAEKTGFTKKDVDKFLTAFVEVVTDSLKKGESVNMVGFGVFKVVSRAARQARNPRTGERISVPAKKIPQFKAGKALKESIA